MAEASFTTIEDKAALRRLETALNKRFRRLDAAA
jgi:hypothetical protein